jgi:hypothetical protein
MKNGVFWDVTPCGSCKNRRFGGAIWQYLVHTLNPNFFCRNETSVILQRHLPCFSEYEETRGSESYSLVC